MRVGRKIFPYPVINRETTYSTFKDSSFKINESIEIEERDGLFVIKNIYYETNNEYIKKLIDKDLIKVYCVVECSYTVYRKEFIIINEPKDIEIDINNLRDVVVISMFGVANKDFDNYQNSSFNKDYEDFKFSLKKNNLLLIDDGFSVKVEYDETEDDKLSSIFNIVKIKEESKTINIMSKSNRINIYLPEKQFDIYTELSKRSITHPIFFSILLIPALYKGLKEIQIKTNKSETNYEEIDDIIRDFSWFRSIVKRFENIYNETLEIETFKSINILELSQKLIDEPIPDAISSIRDLYINDGDEDYYE